MRAARGERTERTPVWFMRQAGRSDPAYNKLREECGLPLEALFRHAELAAEISLLPRRIGVDAIIYFQDILTPLSPMGAHFVFAPGPQLNEPIETLQAVRALHHYDVAEALPFIPETFRRVQAELGGALPVLGFAGAPFTLAAFVLEGKSPGRTCTRTLQFAREEPGAFRTFLDELTDMTIDYLRMQAEAGAAAVQLFESCAFLLSPEQYREYALPYQQRIFDAVREAVPTIMFAREWDAIEDLQLAGADIVSVPSSVSIAQARERLGAAQPLQGNLDNQLLAHGEPAAIEAAALECLCQGAHEGHIFNLSHGLLRETPFDRVVQLVQLVRSFRMEP